MQKKKRLTILIAAAAVLLVIAALGCYYILNVVKQENKYIDWWARLPEGATIDKSWGNLYTVCEGDGFYARISQERSPYVDVQEYIDYYFDRFTANESFRRENGLELLRDETHGKKHILTVRVTDMPEGYADTYTYVTVRSNTLYFYRALLKYDSRYNEEESQKAVDTFVSSFKIKPGIKDYGMSTDFYPVIPDTWSDETRAAYDKLTSPDGFWLGVFSTETEALEERLGHDFPVILKYFHLNDPFPIETLQSCWDEGKLVELTFQLTVNNNEDVFARSPVIDVLAGKYDDTLRTIAASMKEFGHPFMFRLNNEMNSDWTSYSGIVTLSDPDIYIAAWRYIYDFLEAEGVDNAIWIFNPNDNNYPPARWNNFLAYYPGNGYVQLLGVTGYNTGTYYHDVTGEIWRSFPEIYDAVEREYMPYFSEFSWIITEYASSSYGGDKPAWIREMFESFENYPNIKVAVWFDAADYDYRPGKEGIAGRPYWLAETEETLAAYREGMQGTESRFFD